MVVEYVEMQYMSPSSLKGYCRAVELWCNVAEIFRLSNKWRLAIYLLKGGVQKKRAKQIVYKDFAIGEEDALRLFIAELKNHYPSMLIENYVILYVESLNQADADFI